MPKMTEDERDYVRSLNSLRLSDAQIAMILQLMLQLDPDCGPLPTTPNGKRVAAQTFVRLMQGESVERSAWNPKTWRAGHAR